ncbi:hypothetical protein K523DRAFT_257585, partial [Schizophyllum commune Tattone D]
ITNIKSLIPNHQVVPLPAYENGNIVNPNAYEDSIGGSLVHASFKLRHYFEPCLLIIPIGPWIIQPDQFN